MEGRAVGRALGEAAIQADPRFIDLEIGKQGIHFGFDHIKDGFGGIVVVMGKGEFHGVDWLRIHKAGEKRFV